MQFELKIDPEQVELERVEFAKPELLGQPNIAIKEGGLLSVSWDNASVAHLGGVPHFASLFILHLRAKTDSDVRSAVEISSTRLLPEAYRVDNEELAAISLRFDKSSPEIQQSHWRFFPTRVQVIFMSRIHLAMRTRSCAFWT
ncbi:MAG: hypothetical protein IPH31_23870 [Lewinellaceae bacterium]|nr:hypothetical protein [Lewinellaceae bacterium]